MNIYIYIYSNSTSNTSSIDNILHFLDCAHPVGSDFRTPPCQPRNWLIWCQRTGWSPSCCESQKVKSNKTAVLWTSTPWGMIMWPYTNITQSHLLIWKLGEVGQSFNDMLGGLLPKILSGHSRNKSHHRHPTHQNPHARKTTKNQNTKDIHNKGNLDMNASEK